MTAEATNDLAWQAIAEKKQAIREKAIPDEWKKEVHSIEDIEAALTEDEREITGKSAVELVSLMSSGKLKVRPVVEAFCKRATLAHGLTNCLTEILFDDALKQADTLDASFSSSSSKPLLYGLPMTIKDSMNIKGYDSTIGYITLCNKPETDYAAYYQCLVEKGAIVIAKTNVPQTMMAGDSVNNVWGRTVNPHNGNHTAGGSSGGEGAAVRCRASAIGIGTDIAGSIRIPSLCNGTFGLRPSGFRLPLIGQAMPCDLGTSLIVPVAGPLANSPEDLKLSFEAVLEAKPWLKDFTVNCLPFRKVEAPKTFRVGVLPSFGEVIPHPPIQRALEETKAALKNAGFDVFDIQGFPQDSVTMRDQTYKLLGLDSFKSFIDFIREGKEPIVDVIKKANYDLFPKHSLEDIVAAFKGSQIFSATALTALSSQLPGDYDVLLCPGSPYVAPPHDNYLCVDYTVLWNLLDLPAAIIPVTTVDPSKDKPRSLDTSQKTPLAQETEALWDLEQMKGLPACVQLVGKKFREEELLESVIKVESLLK